MDYLQVGITMKVPLIFLVLTIFMVGIAGANTINVNETGWQEGSAVFNHSSTPIQAAINNAVAGDLILIGNGIYQENVEVNESVRILAGPGNVTVISASNNFSVFNVTSDDVTINGMIINANNTSSAGIFVDECDNITITDNNIYNTNLESVFPPRARFSLVTLWNCSNTNVSNNVLNDSFTGIGVISGSYLHLTDNEISQVSRGIKSCLDDYDKGHDVWILNNNISKIGDQGIEIKADNVTISGNTMDNMRFSNARLSSDIDYIKHVRALFGIKVGCYEYPTNNITIRNNRINGIDFDANDITFGFIHQTGIKLCKTTGVLIENNEVSLFRSSINLSSQRGILTSYGENITIKDNNVHSFYLNNSTLKNQLGISAGVNVSNVSIINNTVSDIFSINCTQNSQKGIFISPTSYGNINENIVTSLHAINSNLTSQWAIYLKNDDGNSTGSSISNNTVSDIRFYENSTVDYQAGIFLSHGINNTISNNSIYRVYGSNQSSFYAGLCLTDGENCMIEGNDIDKGINGLILNNTFNCIVAGNRVKNESYGVWFNESRGNSIYNNCFNNATEIKFTNNCSGNIWNTTKTAGLNIAAGPYIGGNYWLKPDGTGFSQTNNFDINGDQICDVAYTIQTGQADHLPLAFQESILPAGITSLSVSGNGSTWINWTWTQPADPDFYQTIIYLNGTFKSNVTGTYYNATGLTDNSNYILQTRTVDASGNINLTWINDTASTPNTLPPASITSLYESGNGSAWINWTWANPPNVDFNHTMVYLNGTFKSNVTGTYYNATDLTDNSNYILQTRTVDTAGNINLTWINNTASTANTLPPASITNLSESKTGSSWINWAWTNPTDVDHNYSMVYLNGVFKNNVSGNSYSATNLLSSNTYEISIKTVDTAGNINSTWINDTASTTASISGSRFSVAQGMSSDLVATTDTRIKKVLAGDVVEYDFSSGDGPVQAINFEATYNEGYVVTTVQVLNQRPVYLKLKPLGFRYQTVSITIGIDGEVLMDSNFMVRFKVSKEWIRLNDIDPATIRLTRYHDGNLNELHTEYLYEDEEYCYFKSTTPGFSIFEIVGDKIAEPTEPVAENKPINTPKTDEPQPVPEDQDTGLAGFTFVWGTIMTGLAGIVCKYRK